MRNVMVEYQYTGDEQVWQQLISDFLNAVEADEVLRGEFHYQVFSYEGGQRLHIGRWSSDEVLKHLQSQPFFGTFAKGVQAMAGDSFSSRFGHELFSTGA